MNRERLSAIGFFLLFAIYGYLGEQIPLDFWAEEDPFTARSFPQLIAIGGAVFSLILAVSSPGSAPAVSLMTMNWQDFLALVVLMGLYGFAIEPIGFIVTTTLFLVSAYIVLGERRPIPLVLASLPVVVGFYLLMDFLGIYLSPGTLFFGIGS